MMLWYIGAGIIIMGATYGAAQVLCAFVLASGVLNGKKQGEVE